MLWPCHTGVTAAVTRHAAFHYSQEARSWSRKRYGRCSSNRARVVRSQESAHPGGCRRLRQIRKGNFLDVGRLVEKNRAEGTLRRASAGALGDPTIEGSGVPTLWVQVGNPF